MLTLSEDKLVELKQFMEQKKKEEFPESHLIAILHKAQELFGYIDPVVIDIVALEMNIPRAHIWGVATFYHYFSLSPKGKHTISVCLGTACYVKGAEQVLEAIKQELKINIGQTSQDGSFTLQETRCLGACGLAPVMMLDDKIYGTLTPKKAVEIIRSCEK